MTQADAPSAPTLPPAIRSAEAVAPAAGPHLTGPHLLFVPDWHAPRFFLWGKAARESSLAVWGDAAKLRVLDDALTVTETRGYAIALTDGIRALASMEASTLHTQSASVTVWSAAAKLLLDLVARERCVPHVVAVADTVADAGKSEPNTEARWAIALSLPEDADRVASLAKSFPVAAHALPLDTVEDAPRIWSSDALLRTFLNMGADALLRMAVKSKRRISARAAWPARWVHALTQAVTAKHCGEFAQHGFAERHVLGELQAWSQPALGAATGVPRACFRFELPDVDSASELFTVRYLLQASDDPSVLVSAADVLAESPAVDALHCGARVAEETLLKSLASAGRLFPAIELSLRQARPDSVQLKADVAWQFINHAAPALTEAGMVVMLPAELTRNGRRRLRMRMRIGPPRGNSLNVQDMALKFRWEAQIDGHVLTAQDLAELAELRAPLVRYRGQWVAVDRDELAQARVLLRKGGGTLSRAEALAAALGGVPAQEPSALPVEVAVDADLNELLRQLRSDTNEAVPTPAALHGQLRHYQQRGLSWLAMMARMQLGACLADDMGLGKTIQLLAFLLHRREQAPESLQPVLLVCPTSVLGNWQREMARFAPTLPVRAHYGAERLRDAQSLQALPPGTVVLTSYGLLRRDAAMLTEVMWSVAVLDEAQNIKNATSRTARTARQLQAEFRVALTGTPVENRLAELWSICEFLNPGLLGSFEGFRREVAIPIERFGRDDAAERLKHIVRPLILRRVKSDPAIIQDLPPKQEATVYCTLTREQASLYQSALDDAMLEIEGSDGIARRGQVLALITALKQICNHPAQYLDEAGPLAGRSGKMERLCEMLDETLAAGDRVLVFTQYREMGERLVRELTRRFGNTVQYLHGGTPRATRDAMVKRFQEDASAPRIFVLSLKAGGTGLNLTAATQVFHFDRWWNPAVEDQATDRAYRIGQRRAVQAHKFLCAGTIEEKVDEMLKSKRDLAERIVGQGEQWITELNNEQLRELFSLSPGSVIGDAEDEA